MGTCFTVKTKNNVTLQTPSNGKEKQEYIDLFKTPSNILNTKDYKLSSGLPTEILEIIFDYLNIINLLLTESIIIKLNYNNGITSFGQQWDISITFNSKHDDNTNKLNTNERIGVVSYSNTHRMAPRPFFKLRQEPLIFQISTALYPKTLEQFINGNVHQDTQKHMKTINIKPNDYMECIDIK
eukprot:53570_1